MTVKPIQALASLASTLVVLGVFLWDGQALAARWESHRDSALLASEAGDTAKAIEQLEAALYFAQNPRAADRDLAGLWEQLANAYLANGQPDLAWDAVARWDGVLVANAQQAWVPEQQVRRDHLTRLLFEQSRTETDRTERADAAPAGEPTPESVPAPVPQPVPGPAPEPTASPDTKSAPGTKSAAPAAEPIALEVAPASAPLQAAARPVGESEPESAEPDQSTAAYGIHLESFRSESAAHDGWQILRDRYPDLLAGKSLSLQSVELEDRGTFLRLIAAPYPSRTGARAACRYLERRAQYCAVRALD